MNRTIAGITLPPISCGRVCCLVRTLEIYTGRTSAVPRTAGIYSQKYMNIITGPTMPQACPLALILKILLSRIIHIPQSSYSIYIIFSSIGTENINAVSVPSRYPTKENIIARLRCPSHPLSLYFGINLRRGYASVGKTARKNKAPKRCHMLPK